MKPDPESFRVLEGSSVHLKDRPTNIEPLYNSKKQYSHLLLKHVTELSSLQELLFAENRHAILLIFQAMDTAGKDSVIKHVMSGVNPQGCQVTSFKHPTQVELQHDFLWRTTRNLPERGKIGIFNRSYYEEVLIARVHPAILRSEHVVDAPPKERDVWKSRFLSMNNLEKHLYCNGTRILKFYLHLSKKEQRKRLLQRMDDPQKNWKFSLGDIEERKYWDHYMKAYEECLEATSTSNVPWYIIPADDRKNARLIVSRILLDTLTDLKMSFPLISKTQSRNLKDIRQELSD